MTLDMFCSHSSISLFQLRSDRQDSALEEHRS
jgi:hypothetical protein